MTIMKSQNVKNRSVFFRYVNFEGNETLEEPVDKN